MGAGLGQGPVQLGAPIGFQVGELAFGLRLFVGADLRDARLASLLPLGFGLDQPLAGLSGGLCLDLGDSFLGFGGPGVFELMDEVLELGTPAGLFLDEVFFLGLLLLFRRFPAALDFGRAPLGLRARQLFFRLGAPGGLQLRDPLGLFCLPDRSRGLDPALDFGLVGLLQVRQTLGLTRGPALICGGEVLFRLGADLRFQLVETGAFGGFVLRNRDRDRLFFFGLPLCPSGVQCLLELRLGAFGVIR